MHTSYKQNEDNFKRIFSTIAPKMLITYEH